jgi:hypothetical protein
MPMNKSTQEYDKDISTAIETILKNRPRSLVKGLEEWNLEDGIILHKGVICVICGCTMLQVEFPH